MTPDTAARAEAQAIADRRTDSIVTMSLDARRGFLAELAENVARERGWVVQAWTDAVPGIVPSVASDFCTDALGVFEQLVEAVYQRSRFCADEVEWLSVRDLPVDGLSRERTLGRLDGEVEDLLDRLLGQALCAWAECTRQTGDEHCSAECRNRAMASVGER